VRGRKPAPRADTTDRPIGTAQEGMDRAMPRRKVHSKVEADGCAVFRVIAAQEEPDNINPDRTLGDAV
jgi:hypothetical protein